MAEMIICSSCGGECSEELANCPYCGSTLLAGAEKKYMEKLRDVKDRMEDLDAVPLEETRSAIRKQGKVLKVGIIIGVVVMTLILGAVYLFNRMLYTDEEDYKQQYLWKQEYYPVLEELYGKNDYDGLFRFYEEHMEDPNAQFYTWEHFDFLRAYMTYVDYSEGLKEGRNVGSSASLFAQQWRAKGDLAKPERYTEAEYAALLPMLEILEQDYQTRWNIDPEEEKLLYQELENNDYYFLDFDTCEKYAKKWSKEN